MTYTKKQFLDDVKKEAVALKKHATREELDNLDIESFDPTAIGFCIYGQLTGSCISERAIELIEKCSLVFIDHDHIPEDENSLKPVKDYQRGANWSPIEKYVTMTSDQENANLIDFLKGNRKDLVL